MQKASHITVQFYQNVGMQPDQILRLSNYIITQYLKRIAETTKTLLYITDPKIIGP